jgi:glutathione S-transferase
MKLYYSPTSPFVRKVMACAIARGLDGRIERMPTNPRDPATPLLADNPLSKVPCLVTDDGTALLDSPVICEYLDSLGDAPKLFPAAGPGRWRALKLQALADGMLEAAILRRLELSRPQDEAREAAAVRLWASVQRGLAQLEREPPGAALDIGSIAVACALGYLEFRFAADPWRAGHPRLTAWHDPFVTAPCLAVTVPKEAG